MRVAGLAARRAVALACLACAAAPAFAQPAAAHAVEWEAGAGAVHRRLVERADDGRRLVRESGPMLRLDAAAQMRLPGGGALRGGAAVAAGRLDYRGQTNFGVPLQTRDTHRDLELALGWRPLAPASWGEAWLQLHALQQRRQIASTDTAQGLRETSTLWLAGVRWTHAFDAAGWQWRPSVEARASVRHRLDVDFGGVFDDTQLRGGRRRELLLGLEASPPASAWRFGIAWSHARQSASAAGTLSLDGVPRGTVRQPRIGIDDVTLRVGRAF